MIGSIHEALGAHNGMVVVKSLGHTIEMSDGCENNEHVEDLV